jgi:hypothetical protein
MAGNAYNSTVPPVFGTLPSLAFLYLTDSFISGDLSYMVGMPAIREHWIDTNPGLGGPLPVAISTLGTLESLSLSSCSFSGTIPPEFGNFGAAMKQMWLYDNDLTGAIPSQLGLLVALRLLQVEGNTFVGSMPAEVCANTVFPLPLETLGADCFDEGFTVRCCNLLCVSPRSKLHWSLRHRRALTMLLMFLLLDHRLLLMTPQRMKSAIAAPAVPF